MRRLSISMYDTRITHTGRGMTMIETVVWISVFTFAMLALTTSVMYFYRTNNYAIEQASAVSSAQRGIENMVKTFREASYASNGAYPIVSIAPNDVVFYADVDNDSQIERVHYYVTGLTLYLGVLDPSGDPAVYVGPETVSSLSDYVHNLDQGVTTFSYFDKNGVQIADFTKIGDVRFVTANVVVNIDPFKLPNQLTLRSSAALRNLVGK